MQLRKTIGLLAFFPLISLASCGQRDIISYYLEANTTNVKLEYNVGDYFNPEGLIVNTIKIVNGEIRSVTETKDYTFSIDLNEKLTKEISEVFVYSPKPNVLPARFEITVNNPVFGIGEQQNLNDLYPGYTFTSTNNFVGRVRADGILETYREGEFSLAGVNQGQPGIYLDCVVNVDDSIDYPAFKLPGSTSGFLSELSIDACLLEKTEYPIRYVASDHKRAEYSYEVTNPEVATIEIDPAFGDVTLKTIKPGDSRLKIYFTENGVKTLAYDRYFKVVTPFDPYELSALLSGTQWLGFSNPAQQMALNFTENGTATLAGYKTKNLPFTFKLNQQPTEVVDTTKLAVFDCENTDDFVKITKLQVNLTGGFINLFDQNGIIEGFRIAI